MKVEYIRFPYIYGEGERLEFKNIIGTVNVGDEIIDNKVIKSNYTDVDCPNGVCPLK